MTRSMIRPLVAALLVITALAIGSPQAARAQPPVKVHHKTVQVGDLEIFYREAGPKDACHLDDAQAGPGRDEPAFTGRRLGADLPWRRPLD